MGKLSEEQKHKIMGRRGFKSAKDGKKYPPSQLEIHHIDRNPKNNDPRNLKVLTKQQHKALHKRAGR
jgi:hypothetical protein